MTLCFLRAMCGAVAAAALSTGAHGQPAPSPGELSRQLEPARPSALPELQIQPPRLQQPSRPAPGAQVARIQRWRVLGNQVLTEEALQSLLQAFTDVELSLQQIREAAALVQQAFEDAGWLARVDVPAQDITEGSVTLEVTQSRLGQVRFDANASSLVATERVREVVLTHQATGQAIHLPALNRGLLLADDLNGVSVVGSLQAGSQPGDTDVLLSATAQAPYSLDLSLDNNNSRAVGAHKLSAAATWVSPAGWGEVYELQSFASEGSDYLRLGASAPVAGVLGSRGLKASAYVSRMNYRIVTPDGGGARQDISGNSETAGVELSYPLLRSLKANLYVTVASDERHYRGQANGQANSSYSLRGRQVGISGNVFDSWGGGAATSYGLTQRHGRVGPSDLPAIDNLPVQGNFQKRNWNLSRQQAISQALSLYLVAQGQNTGSKLLDSSENMSLGGSSGVRAYPSGEASGPQGHVASVELRWRLDPQWLLTAFYDQGRIEKRRSDTRPSYSLEGVGLSATWTAPGAWTSRLTYARRLGRNPNADPNTGKDNDGSLSHGRLWMSLSRSF